jgi:hypothetical protein
MLVFQAVAKLFSPRKPYYTKFKACDLGSFVPEQDLFFRWVAGQTGAKLAIW